MCSGRPTPREDPQYELPTLERLSKLDLGVHPILSFPDGQCCTSLFMQLFPVLHSEGKTNKAGPQPAPYRKLMRRVINRCALSVLAALFMLNPATQTERS